MEKQGQDDQLPPPTYSPPGAEPCSEIIATATEAAPQQTQPEEQLEKSAAVSPCNITENTVPVEKDPAKSVPAPEAPLVTSLEQLNDVPKLVDCPFCQYRATTKVFEENSSQTTIAALLCCIFCGIICAVVPYLCRWAQEYHHFCGNCGAKVAIRPTDGPVQVQRPRPPPSMPSNYPATPAAPAPTVHK